MRILTLNTDIATLQPQVVISPKSPWSDLITDDMVERAISVFQGVDHFDEISNWAGMMISLNALVPYALDEFKQRLIDVNNGSFQIMVDDSPESNGLPKLYELAVYKILYPHNDELKISTQYYNSLLRSVNDGLNSIPVFGHLLLLLKMMKPGDNLSNKLSQRLREVLYKHLWEMVGQKSFDYTDRNFVLHLMLAIPEWIRGFSILSPYKEFIHEQTEFHLSNNRPELYWPLLLTGILLENPQLGISASGELNLFVNQMVESNLSSERIF